MPAASVAAPSAAKTVTCPYCQYTQTASPHGLSVFCKNCNRRVDLASLEQPKPAAPPRPALRSLSCPGCQAIQQVPANALSAFCQKCGKRINLQDYQIRGKFNGDIQTKGTLSILLGGDVRADVHVGNAIIEGKMVGTIYADGKVEVRSTGCLWGNVYARAVVIHDGATIVGNCKIPS